VIKQVKTTYRLPDLRKAALIIYAVFFVAVNAFCCFYLFSRYGRLVAWYTNLNDCFYRVRYWSHSFFTPGVKSDGNMYCVIAIVASLLMFAYVRRALRRERAFPVQEAGISYKVGDLLPISLGIFICLALWLWGNHMAMPAYDEVFSAQNAAGIHPFQCVSYYMLPNNHLLFNFINAILFHAADDKVVTGRILSLFVYCALMVVLFAWFNKLVRNRWVALLIAVTGILQFQVWGFSFQARGYELFLLAGWGMVISLLGYLASLQRKWLYVNILSCAAGYFCMPSFFYLHVAQIVFMLLYLFFYQQRVVALWKAQVAAILFGFLLYLPALCFSGLAAIAANGYVAPMSYFKNAGLGALLSWMGPVVMHHITLIFSDVHWQNVSFGLLFYLLPVALLFNRKNKNDVLFGMFYVGMWLVFFVIAIAMKRTPFDRNLICQDSITLVAVIRVLAWVVGIADSNSKRLLLRRSIFAVLMLLLSFHFLSTNETSLKDGLYEYDVNRTYADISTGLQLIPAGSTLAFSDLGFYCNYVCRQHGLKTDNCASYHEDYFVRHRYDELPAAVEQGYVLAGKFDLYEVYKRK